MLSPAKNTYDKNEVATWPIPNYWDGVGLLLVLALIVFITLGAKAMLGSYQLGEVLPISLDPIELPYYALRSVLRMFIALACSLLFTFSVGTVAAKNRYAERLIIPLIDILQSVPVLGFLTITAVGFVVLFRGSLLGPECAAIFAIFTSQVWNMVLSFYQSLKTLPEDLHEVAEIFHLSAWQRFWRVEVPFSMPSLLWNTMLSMSASWVFLVASEAFTIANQNITLPGLGSYIGLAIQQKDLSAIAYVLVTMFIVIALYDQLLFRPLVAWSEKFKMEKTGSDVMSSSWVLDLFQRMRFFSFLGRFFSLFANGFVNFHWFRRKVNYRPHGTRRVLRKRILIGIWNAFLIGLIGVAVWLLLHFIFSEVSVHEVLHVLYLGGMTGLRVLILIVLSTVIWVPIGVAIGLSPRAAQIVQPIAQFLASFPANLLFPLVGVLILKFHLNVNIWVSPLVILGAQWYILFNVVAGTAALPKNLLEAAGIFGVKGWLWWRRLILPAVFPYFITGAITAAGGAWNISIIAEAVSWGKTQLYATGVGAYITQVSALGDFPKLALGVTIMSMYVLVLNRLLWRPLYNLAEKHYQIR